MPKAKTKHGEIKEDLRAIVEAIEEEITLAARIRELLDEFENAILLQSLERED